LVVCGHIKKIQKQQDLYWSNLFISEKALMRQRKKICFRFGCCGCLMGLATAHRLARRGGQPVGGAESLLKNLTTAGKMDQLPI
jgi:hypothetical protein